MNNMSDSMSIPFDHRIAVHGSDEEFVAAAVPFLLEGIAADDEPAPLMISTSRKLDLVRDALGSDAKLVEFMPGADWYTGSAANALARAAGDTATQAPGGRFHIVAEPDWTGRPGSSGREIAEWIRYESMVNVMLASVPGHSMCPYDTRTASPEIVAAARQCHPAEMAGGERRTSTAFADPLEVIAELDAAPLPEPPADAPAIRLESDVPAVRRFVRDHATAHRLDAVDAGVFESAVAEVAHFALIEGGPDTLVRMWAVPGASVCEVHSPSGRISDPLLGFRPPDSLEPEPGQGLWFTRQVCDYVDVRSGVDGWTIRVQSRTLKLSLSE